MNKVVLKLFFPLAVIGLVTGCASPSSSISQVAVDAVTLTDARQDPQSHEGALVRWGGVITEVENKPDSTLVLMVERELRDNEKPISDGASEGRFIARFQGFIDPLVYKTGRPLTVVGRLNGSRIRPIGEYDYRFALVEVRDSHLWSEPSKTPVYYPPPPVWYYDLHYYHRYPYRHPRW